MYLYEINGKYYNELEVIAYFKLKGYTRNLEHQRKQGILCHRKELDFQPIIQGYKKPMYNGKDKDGNVIIRYER